MSEIVLDDITAADELDPTSDIPDGQVLESAVSSLESTMLSINELLNNGTCSAESLMLTRVVDINVRNAVGAPVTALAHEKDATLYTQALLALEGLNQTVVEVLRKIWAYIKSLWGTFTAWVDRVFDQNTYTRATVDKILAEIAEMKSAGTQINLPPDAKMSAPPALLAFFDFSGMAGINNASEFLNRHLSNVLETRLRANQGYRQSFVALANHLVENSEGLSMQDMAGIAPAYGPMSAEWTKKGTTSLFGEAYHTYVSNLLPGGYRMTFSRLELSQARADKLHDRNPEMVLHLIGRDKATLTRDQSRMNVLKAVPVASLDRLKLFVGGISHVLELSGRVYTDTQEFVRVTDAAINKLEPIISRLQRAGADTDQGRVLNAGFQAVRRVLENYVSINHTHLNYTRIACAGYAEMAKGQLALLKKHSA